MSLPTYLDHPSTKCDELQYTIDRLVKEATKIKAFNASQFCLKLPEKIRSTQKSEARKKDENNMNSKTKLKAVKAFMAKQRRARENGDDKNKRKNKTMQPPTTPNGNLNAGRRGNPPKKDNSHASTTNNEYSEEK